MKVKTGWRWVLISIFCILLAGQAGAASFTLTVKTQGSGTVTKNPTNSTYPQGVVVTVTATPDAGWYFANWSGGVNGTINPTNVSMFKNTVITGNFLQVPTYTLTLATNGQGTITLNPAGGSYLSNSVVTATATPAAGWVFVSWSGSTNSSANPLSLTIHTNLSLAGTFAQLPAFDVQPHSVTNIAGSTVSFSAHAIGSAPLNYQWFFSGGTLTGATNNLLTFTNAPLSKAGNYWLVATNSHGAATSSVVSLTLTNANGPANVVGSPDEGSLRAAIAIGGWISLAFNGTITLTNTINITKDVILDAQNVSATISGGNAVRLFYVAPGVRFSATNLTLANGSCIVTNGTPGTPADAGAIYIDGGTVTLVGCTVTNNNAQSTLRGGLARGGAIFNNGGTVSLFGSGISNNAVLGGRDTDDLSSDWGFGGAIFTTNGFLTIVNCSVNSNLCTSGIDLDGGSYGGALFQASGSLAITNSLFASNLALGKSGFGGSPNPGGLPAYGGALAVFAGNVTIDHSQFYTNTAKGGNAGYHAWSAPAFGGAIYCAAVLEVRNSTFCGNQALSGTGGYNAGDSSFHDASGSGGAIYNSGTAILNNCCVYSNYSQGGTPVVYSLNHSTANGGDGLGGGIFNASQFAATNCTIALNFALAGSGFPTYFSVPPGTNGNALGGGVYNDTNATFLAMNVTIANNYCIASGAGLSGYTGLAAGAQVANTNGTLRLRKSLIAYGGTNGNAYGTIADGGYNISSDGSANLTGGSSYNFTDPQLAPLANYGGPTPCMALCPDSPAMDWGDSAGAPATDQRGYARPHGDGVDLGAYEYYSDQVQVLSLASRSNSVVLAFRGYVGSPPITYHLQASADLSSWTNISTNGPYDDSTNVSQTISPQGPGSLFFRLLILQ